MFFIIIMGVAILYFAILLWKKPHNLGYPSLAALVALMGLCILIDQGRLNKYKLQMGDKVYRVSSSDFQSFFEENINDIGVALVDVYEKYYVVDMIDSKKDAGKWKFIKKDGKTFLGLKLQYPPLVKTIAVRSSGGSIMTPCKEDFYESDYFYTVLIEKEDPQDYMEKSIIESIENGEVLFEVKYLRKVQSEKLSNTTGSR